MSYIEEKANELAIMLAKDFKRKGYDDDRQIKEISKSLLINFNRVFINRFNRELQSTPGDK